MDSFEQAGSREPTNTEAADMRLRTGGRRSPLLMAAVAALALAGCGGGSSGGGGNTSPPPPPPGLVCTATDGGGTGFSLGVCATESAFQQIEANVQVLADGYVLTLTGPASLPAFDPPLAPFAFGTAERTPAGTREIIGALRGEAYELDARPGPPSADAPLVPSVALVDFRRAWSHAQPAPLTDANTVAPPLALGSFGFWEHFPNVVDGYFGGWYAPRAAATGVDERPTTLRSYEGVAVGVLSPKVPGGGGWTASRGFSAKVTIEAGPTGIIVGAITDVESSVGNESHLAVQPVAVKVLSFTGTDNIAGQPVRGSLATTTTGTGADATGQVEARFLGVAGGAPADLGSEIAGRFVFETSNGLVGSGAFGAVVQP